MILLRSFFCEDFALQYFFLGLDDMGGDQGWFMIIWFFTVLRTDLVHLNSLIICWSPWCCEVPGQFILFIIFSFYISWFLLMIGFLSLFDGGVSLLLLLIACLSLLLPELFHLSLSTSLCSLCTVCIFRKLPVILYGSCEVLWRCFRARPS